MSNYPDFESLHHAHGVPPLKGIIRATPQDFKVMEVPAFEPSGDGEHRLIQIRKTGLNTAIVAQRLAALAKLPDAKVSWAGLKDRNAVAEQWFGVHLANHPEPDWRQLNGEQLEILDVKQHRKKLKTGVLKGNRFEIRITDIGNDISLLPERLEKIISLGVPNYYGEQRFGRHGQNLEKALKLFNPPKGKKRKRIKRHLRSIYLSAARSMLFNAVLDQRIQDGNWNQLLPGDICMLDNSHSIFKADDDPTLPERLKAFDIHPTGPLWGEGDLPSDRDCAQIESEVVQRTPEFATGVAKAGMKQQRRSLRLTAKNISIETESDSALIKFELPAGSYATSVLRELILFSTPKQTTV